MTIIFELCFYCKYATYILVIGNPAKQFARKRADLDQTDDIEVIMSALQEMKLIIQKNGQFSSCSIDAVHFFSHSF